MSTLEPIVTKGEAIEPEKTTDACPQCGKHYEWIPGREWYAGCEQRMVDLDPYQISLWICDCGGCVAVMVGKVRQEDSFHVYVQAMEAVTPRSNSDHGMDEFQ